MHEAHDYWDAVRRADDDAARAVVRRARADGATVLDVVDTIVVPAQDRVDELALTGAWTPVRAAAAASLAEGVLLELASSAPEPIADPAPVLVATLPGDPHAVPAVAAVAALRAAGLRVVLDDGPDPDRLLHEVLGMKPRAVVFWASLAAGLAWSKVLVGHVRAVGIPVVGGGTAFGHDGRRALALGATDWAATARDVPDVVAGLPDRVRPLGPSDPTPADAEAAEVLRDRAATTAYVVRGVGAHSAGVDLEGLVDHVLGCLASALATADESVLVEARDRLERAFGAEGTRVVAEVWCLLGESLRGHPLARVHLAGAAPLEAPLEGPEPVVSAAG